jgi:hypothetical protein
MVTFKESDHSYRNADGDLYTSVTTLLKKLVEPFDELAVAEKCSTKKPTEKYPNKWYGVPVPTILDAWKNERERAAELGTWYHSYREHLLYTLPNVITPNIDESTGIKKALGQRLLDNTIYPEFLCYLPSKKVAGQIDYLKVKDSVVYINDYKTSKVIKRKGFTNWEGITKMMYAPVSHLDDCEYSKYALQLSLYMYIVLRHNPKLKPGTMTIEHVLFEEEAQDQWGYPIYKKNEFGEPIVKEINYIEVPFLKDEVVAILNTL